MRYCLEVKRIRTVTEKIIVNADSPHVAIAKGYSLCKSGKVNLNNPIDDSEEWEVDIDLDSAREDDTFDEDQFSDLGIQEWK